MKIVTERYLLVDDVRFKLFDDIAFRILNTKTNHWDLIIGTIIGFGESDDGEYIILNNVERNREPHNTIVYYLKDMTKVNEVA